MRKAIFTLMLTIMSLGMMAAELNIYASGLKAEVSDNVAAVSYVLNAPATALELQLINDGTVVTTIAITDATALTKGSHTVNVPLTGAAGTYTWALKASAAANTALTLVSNDSSIYNFYSPQGIAVDNCPESPYFGRIYVTESRHNQSTGNGRTLSQGVYIFTPTLEQATAQGNVGYAGNVPWNESTTTDVNSIAYGQYGPYRIDVDEAGYVFICDNGRISDTENTSGIWIMDPANPSADFVAALDTTKRGTLYTRINSLTVAGAGENRILYANDWTDAIVRYPIGNNVPYSVIPSKTDSLFTLADINIASANNTLCQDGKGGFWIFQYRGALDTYPILTHINASGVRDFYISSENNAELAPSKTNPCRRGGGAVSPDGTLLAFNCDKNVYIFQITWTEGIPSLTQLAKVASGTNVEGFDFDVANNLYYASASTEYFRAYATPKADNTFVTPAPKVNTITVTAATPALNIYASGLKAEVSNNVAVISYVLNAPATALELQLINEGTVATTIAITDATALTKGSHIVNVPLTGEAGTYTWALKASAAANMEVVEITASNPNEMYSFYSPQGVTVDNSFESPYFGRVYVAESMDGDTDGGTETTRTQKRGIFIYDATLNFVYDQKNVGFAGNVEWTAGSRQGCRRVKTDAQGNVYVCDNDAVSNAYRMDPANPSNDFVPILDYSKRTQIYNKINAIELMGEGEDMRMVAIDWSDALVSFPIGKGIPYASAPDTLANLAQYNHVNSESSLGKDAHGGWWTFQFRGQLDTYPMMMHIDSKGIADFRLSSANNAEIAPSTGERGGGGVNCDGSLVALGGAKVVNMYNVTYDENDQVTVTKSDWTFPVTGKNIENIAFDVANNVYVVSATSEKLHVYATPKADNSFVTPAPKANTITIESGSVSKFYDEEIKFTEKVAAGSIVSPLAGESGDWTIALTDPENKISIDANNSYFLTQKGIVKYEYRMKTGGKTSIKNDVAQKNFMTVTFPADGWFTFAVRTGSNTDDTRTVQVIAGTDTLYNAAPSEALAIEANVNGNKNNVYPIAIVPVKQGTADIYYPINAVNFYSFGFTTIEPKITAEVTPWVNVESITLDQHELALEVEETGKLNATITPNNASKATYTWVVADNTIATIESGVVTAIAEGVTTVYAIADEDTTLYDSCVVTVSPKTIYYPNIYAYGLSVVPGNETNGYKFTYSLNAPATEVNLVINDTKIALSGLEIGENEAEVVLTDLAEGEYNWSIEAKAELVAEDEAILSNVGTQNKFTAPRGVAVNSNPASPYFGTTYVVENNGKVSEGAGLYVYDPLQETDGTLYSSGWSPAAASPMRVQIGQDDDQIYISDWSDMITNIHVLNPADLTQESLIFGDTTMGEYSSTGVYTSNGVTVHGSMSSCYVMGKDENRVLYTFDEDIQPEGMAHKMGMFQYNIGKNETPWVAAPSAIVFGNDDNFEQNGNSVIIPDAFGGWWISQDRAADAYAIPALIHIDATGKVDFNSNSMLGGRTRGALAFNADQSVMITASDNSIRVWDVEWSETNVPTISLNYPIETKFGAQTASTCYSLAIDYAGNIYGIGDGQPLCVWASVKEENSCVTPANETIAIIGSGLENINNNFIGKKGIYSMTGQYLGTDESILTQGIYIINGKKVVK